MNNSQAHPVAKEAAEALAASRARAEQNAAELAERIAERQRQRQIATVVAERVVETPKIEWKPREAPKAANVELLELEGKIEVYEKKLKRQAKPLGWARRQAMKAELVELKAKRKELKKS
jgi:hypothetical protein